MKLMTPLISNVMTKERMKRSMIYLSLRFLYYYALFLRTTEQ